MSSASAIILMYYSKHPKSLALSSQFFFYESYSLSPSRGLFLAKLIMFYSNSYRVSLPIAYLNSLGYKPFVVLTAATRDAKVFGSSFFLRAYAMCVYTTSFWSHTLTSSVSNSVGSPTNIVFLSIFNRVFTLGCLPISLRTPSWNSY